MASFAIMTILMTTTVFSDFDCSNRQCCTGEGNADIDCTTLSPHECTLTYGYMCHWDCSSSDTNSLDTKLRLAGYTIKSYISTSLGNGEYHDPIVSQIPISPHSEPKSVSDVIKYTSIQSIDDCGIIHRYEMDEISANNILNLLNDDNEENTDNPNDNTALINRFIRRLTIFDNDGRQDVTDSGRYDWNGYIQFSSSSGKEKRCSGTLIADDVLITAAHCIHSGVGPWTAEYFSNWRFYPGTNGDENNMRGRQIRASNAWVLNEWTSQGVQTSSGEYGPNWDYDIGVIFLSHPAPQYGVMAFNYNDNLSHGTVFKTVGYPGDKSWLTQWYQQCDWGYVGSEFMATDTCDIYAGSSGSPVYRYEYASRQTEINCIVSWENDYVNGCARITQSKYYTVCAIAQVLQPNTNCQVA